MIGVEIIAAFLRRMFTPSAWKWNCNFEQKNDSNLEKLFIVLVLSPLKFTNKGFHNAPLAKASENLLSSTPPPASIFGSNWETAIIILCLSSLRWLSLKIIARHSGVQILGCTVQDSWTKVVCIENAPSFPRSRFWLLCWNKFLGSIIIIINHKTKLSTHRQTTI